MSDLRAELEQLRLEVEEERKRHIKELAKFTGKLTELIACIDLDSDSVSVAANKDAIKKENAVESKPDASHEPKAEKSPSFEPGSVDDPNFTDFEKEGLKAHNEYRKLHGVQPLKLSRELCNFAQEWAHHLCRINCLQHRTERQGRGENLWGGYGVTNVSARDPVKAWYDEVRFYNYQCGSFSMQTGHFTQVVWKDSREVGIAIARNSSGATYVAANYYPAGNFMGQFQNNVFPPK